MALHHNAIYAMDYVGQGETHFPLIELDQDHTVLGSELHEVVGRGEGLAPKAGVAGQSCCRAHAAVCTSGRFKIDPPQSILCARYHGGSCKVKIITEPHVH
jgi:hypothetical protein